MPKDTNNKLLITEAIQTLVQLSHVHDLQSQLLQIFRALNQVLYNPNKELHDQAMDVCNDHDHLAISSYLILILIRQSVTSFVHTTLIQRSKC